MAESTVAHGAGGLVDLDWAGRRVSIEHAWLGAGRADAPLVVFLHEGLGSLSMWKDWPARLCEAAGTRGLVYSRPGYGASTPRAPGERWGVDFMHRQAIEVLPALLAALGVDARRERPWLFGHSDGGSIALIHAARFADRVGGVVVAAPHIMIEAVSIASIRQAREAYRGTDLAARLARYHADPDSAFWGWNDIWLDPDFARWTIEHELSSIVCPVLAVQGHDDEYGTMAQIDGIRRCAPQTELLRLDACGHSPHRDQPDALIHAVGGFIRRHDDRATASAG